MAPLYKVCLIGSGGVGTIASLVLTKSGQAEVTAVLRSKYQYVAEHGWDIESVDHGTLANWKPHRVVGSVDDAAVDDQRKKVQYDFVVVCTKQLPDRSPVVPMIAAVVTPGHTAIVLIQNGIGIDEPLTQAWPGNTVLSSVSHIGSGVSGANKVRQIGRDVSKIGVHAGSAAVAAEYIGMYKAGGAAEVELAEDIRAARWEKLLWNGTFNTVCALTRTDVGAIQRSRGRETLLVPMMQEIWSIAAADGHKLGDDIVQWMAYRLPDDCPYRASMLVDVENGRPMELEVILGNPIKEARRLGVATPVMDTVYRLLQVEAWKIDEAAKG